MELYSGFLSNRELDDLNQYIDSISHRFIHYDINVNLVNVRYMSVIDDFLFNLYNDEYKRAVGGVLKRAYLLEYVPGSFADIHYDIGTNITCVTVLKQENLIGGDAVFANDYDDITLTKTNHVMKHTKKNWRCYDVIKMNPGDCISYSQKELHGVTKVNKGLRRVLVHWFET